MEEGKTRILGCGTEKEKHKCKNQKTAGVFQLLQDMITRVALYIEFC